MQLANTAPGSAGSARAGPLLLNPLPTSNGGLGVSQLSASAITILYTSPSSLATRELSLPTQFTRCMSKMYSASLGQPCGGATCERHSHFCRTSQSHMRGLLLAMSTAELLLLRETTAGALRSTEVCRVYALGMQWAGTAHVARPKSCITYVKSRHHKAYCTHVESVPMSPCRADA